MVCLALLGSVIAGAHYVAVDLPAQKNLQAPENSKWNRAGCEICKGNCANDPDYWWCLSVCEDLLCQ